MSSNQKAEVQKKNFSFENFAKLIYRRQTEKDADTFIIVYGLPRTGKTTLGFNIIMPYLRLMRRKHSEGEIDWNPGRWKTVLKNNFAMDAVDMNKKVMKNPRKSVTFVDEATDTLSWMDMMTKEQQELLKLMQKTGEKHMLTILVVPNMKLLTKTMLSRAHYLFMITEEPIGNKNDFFVFKNWRNPMLAEEKPFGIFEIIKKLTKYPKLASTSEKLDSYLIRQERCVGKFKFRKIDERIYNLYKKLVKEPAMEREPEKRKSVPFYKYKKLKYTLDTLLYNLHMKDGKAIAQIDRLCTDQFGENILSRNTIEKYINQISATEKKPVLEEEEAIKPVEREEIRKEEDIEIGEESGE